MPRLPHPGKDKGDWGRILNEYLLVSHSESGDLLIQVWADDAARPAKAQERQFGYNRARGSFELFLDAQWNEITPSVSFKQNAPRSLQQRARMQPDLLDFGAIADGQSDTSAALREAIQYCLEHQLGILRIPAGTYRFKEPLRFGAQAASPQLLDFAGLRILGDGLQTILRIDAGSQFSGIRRLSLEELQLQQTTGSEAPLVQIDRGSQQLHLRRLVLDGGRSAPLGFRLLVDSASTNELSEVLIEDCRGERLSTAFHVKVQGSASAEQLRIRGGSFGASDVGITLEGVAGSEQAIDLNVDSVSLQSVRASLESTHFSGAVFLNNRFSTRRAEQVIRIVGGRGGVIQSNVLSGDLLRNFIFFEKEDSTESVPAKAWQVFANLFQGTCLAEAMNADAGAIQRVQLANNFAVEDGITLRAKAFDTQG